MTKIKAPRKTFWQGGAWSSAPARPPHPPALAREPTSRSRGGSLHDMQSTRTRATHQFKNRCQRIKVILYFASSRGAPRWDWKTEKPDPTNDDKKNACDEREAERLTLARTDNCGANN